MDAQKAGELEKVRSILLATLDYHIANYPKTISADFNSDEYYSSLKQQVQAKYQKGRLAMLQQWLRDFTEEPRESRDVAYVRYIQETTGYVFDIFEVFRKRVAAIILRNKITTENQYRDVLEMVDVLSQEEPLDAERIQVLNVLLYKFDNKGTIGKGKVVRLGKAPTDYTNTRILEAWSPSGIRSMAIYETGTPENSVTQVTMDFGNGGGAGVFAAKGRGLGIQVRWVNEDTIEVTAPAGLAVVKREERLQSYQEVVRVVYR